MLTMKIQSNQIQQSDDKSIEPKPDPAEEAPVQI